MPATQSANEWETYWRATSQLVAQPDEDAASIWDADADVVAASDLERFREVADRGLPLVDLGCGSGVQTRYLADHFARVVGVDVSAAAVALAQAKHPAPNLVYRMLDVFDSAAVAALHQELGDVNLYMRTLLHLVRPEARPAFAASVSALLGRRGTLYLYELGAAAHAYFGGFIQRNGMPVPLQRVLAAGIQPGSVDREHVLSMFPADAFEIISDGETSAVPVRVRVVGSPPAFAAELWSPPAYYMVLKPRAT